MGRATEILTLTLPDGAKAQIEAALQNGEDMSAFAREATSNLLEKRGHPRLPDLPKRKPVYPRK